MEYIRRFAENKVLKLSAMFPVVLVTGPRQCGKTTMLQKLSEEQRTYVSLDVFSVRELAQSDPRLFFQKYKTPVFIDEVQYAPSLFPYIKSMADSHHINGEFWLSGSENFRIMQNASESLAGRMGIVDITSMLYQEINGGNSMLPQNFSFSTLTGRDNFHFNLKNVFNYIYCGGMPAQLTYNDEQRAEYYNSYIATYLMRDAVEFGKITDVLRFHKFLSAVASQNTHVVNYADLATAAGISQPTAKEWLMLLEGMGIVWTLQPYFSNIYKRLVKTPKLYFYDTGLCCSLLKIPSADVLLNSFLAGEYFENFVMNLLKIRYMLDSASPNMFFYRDIDRNEIDILLEDFSGITPLEIKLSASPDKSCVKKFAILKKLKKKINPGGIVCLAEELLPVDTDNSVIPAGCL